MHTHSMHTYPICIPICTRCSISNVGAARLAAAGKQAWKQAFQSRKRDHPKLQPFGFLVNVFRGREIQALKSRRPAHAVTVRRASEPGPCWNFRYITPTSDMLSLGWRCRFRRASTSTGRRRGSHHAGCRIRDNNRTGGHRRRTHIGTPPLSHITLVRSSVRPFRVGQ